MGGLLGISWLIHAISPFEVTSCAICVQSAGVPIAAPALSVLARAVNFCATNLPNASPASISLLVAVPAMILASSCSSNFCWIYAISPGNNNFIISAVTPANTALSEG